MAAPLQPDDVVDLRFAYSTDAYVNEEGIFIDDISPVPSYGSRSVIAEAHADTFLVREPDSITTYAYRVRAFDGEGHMSRWSPLAFYLVTVYADSDGMPGAGSGLESVYPNPFNPVTSVRFTVGERDAAASGRAAVRLDVFDAAGRRMAVIEDGFREAGTYSVTWDGTLTGGGTAASGIYFIRLTVGLKSFSRKTVLLR